MEKKGNIWELQWGIRYNKIFFKAFDNDERAEFLQYVTGSSKVPLEEFCALQDIGEINKELLYERLTSAIREGKNGFGFVYFGTNKIFRKTVDARQ